MVGDRWETGGRPVGDRWESGGRPVGDRWETGGRPVGDRWETGGRDRLLPVVIYVSLVDRYLHRYIGYA